MTVEQRNTPTGKAQPYDTLTLLGAHLVWSMLGPMALLFLLAGIVSRGGGWYTAMDIAYFVALVLTVGCRWRLQRSGRTVTTDGIPSTWPQFRRWVLCLVPIAVVAWTAANLVGYYFVRGVGTRAGLA